MIYEIREVMKILTRMAHQRRRGELSSVASVVCNSCNNSVTHVQFRQSPIIWKSADNPIIANIFWGVHVRFSGDLEQSSNLLKRGSLSYQEKSGQNSSSESNRRSLLQQAR